MSDWGLIVGAAGLLLALVLPRLVRNYRAWRYERQTLENIRKRYKP